MPPLLIPPLSYLISSGATTPRTTPASEEFARLLALVREAVKSHVSLVQLREKNLTPRTLYELTAAAADITRRSTTRLLVNDRADIARAAGADGVHLTTNSLEAAVVRCICKPDFLIGVSTHSLDEALASRAGGADFAVFGPVFETPDKLSYGAPLGLEKLRAAARALAPFPLIALGGVTRDNAAECLRAGASGVAAIRLFNDAPQLREIVREIESMA